MAVIYEEFISLATRLSQAASRGNRPAVKDAIDSLEEAAEKIGNAWCGSWLGYHSRVYYKSLQEPPPGIHFSQEWGLMNTLGNDTSNHWREFSYEIIQRAVLEVANNPDLRMIDQEVENTLEEFESGRDELRSLISLLQDAQKDEYITKLIDDAEKIKAYSIVEVANNLRPSGRLMSRDATAVYQGVQIPPHVEEVARVIYWRTAFDSCNELSKIAKNIANHLSRMEGVAVVHESLNEKKVFIGHGRSPLWRDLKDFLQDRLSLSWDEFNRVPVAGITNKERLSEMMGSAIIAFLILTGEDEKVSGELHARMNVVHEAGLFQGRLGFNRAIVLLEDECAEFSNISGLGQIRFPKGNIKACFEEIRRVLEREGIVEQK